MREQRKKYTEIRERERIQGREKEREKRGQGEKEGKTDTEGEGQRDRKNRHSVIRGGIEPNISGASPRKSEKMTKRIEERGKNRQTE